MEKKYKHRNISLLIWKPLPNSPQCLKLYIYTRYPWNKTKHSCSKQIPWKMRYIHQEWDRSTQMEATHYWRLPSYWTQYGRPWGWLRIALEPTYHIKPQTPLLYHVFIFSLIFLFQLMSIICYYWPVLTLMANITNLTCSNILLNQTSPHHTSKLLLDFIL